MYSYLHMSICLYICISVYPYIYIYNYTYVCTYIHVCIYMYVYIYNVWICTYMYIYTDTKGQRIHYTHSTFWITFYTHRVCVCVCILFGFSSGCTEWKGRTAFVSVFYARWIFAVLHLYIWVHTYTYIYIYIHVDIYTHTHTHKYSHTQTYTLIYTYIRTHARPHPHTHTHAHAHTPHLYLRPHSRLHPYTCYSLQHMKKSKKPSGDTTKEMNIYPLFKLSPLPLCLRFFFNGALYFWISVTVSHPLCLCAFLPVKMIHFGILCMYIQIYIYIHIYI